MKLCKYCGWAEVSSANSGFCSPEHKKAYEKAHPKKQPRTARQNRALWLFFQHLAESLNEGGLDMRVVLKPNVSIPWTKNSVHDYLWVPLQKAMFDSESTKELAKSENINKIHEVLIRHLGEKFGLEVPPFPHYESEEAYNRATSVTSVKERI